jgi:hypothetical protein
MGLSKEPKEVDFYVIDKIWTDKERKEFSEFIKIRKEQVKKKARLPGISVRRHAAAATR